tara:strand:+ start:10226 stop:10390 length:165 start_codon:yes stop_codon:yes gene_type:complete
MLELTKTELNYLIMMIEKNLKKNKTIEDKDFITMIHKLYSKLVIRENEDFNVVS